jgi:DHA1 family bicyclomycin/chloramphenicol resistance-like MFS transporter
MSRPAPRSRPGNVELTALLALSMSLAALGIDTMLPAFPAIRADLGLAPASTAVTGLLTAYFLGLASGQLLYGPISDRFGRKPTLYVGYGVYALGAAAATLAPSLSLLLIARFVWGLGAAGPRVVTLAVVRDSFEGERMSRAMSLIMAVFILVPVVAPTLGAAIVSVASWRWVFGSALIAAAAMALWALRLPETLAPEHRMPLRFDRIAAAGRLVVTNGVTMAYTLAMTALFGVFTSYLGTAESIFGTTFGRPDAFPLIFGGLAVVMGLAMLVNATVVSRIGTRRLSHAVLVGYVVAAGMLTTLAVATGGVPPFAWYLVGLAVMLFSHALLIPNFNTIAMQPMAAIAGTASAVVGAVQVAGGALLGRLLDRAYDGTVLPLSLGFLGLGAVAVALVLWAESGRLFQPLTAPDPSAGRTEPVNA